MIRGRKYIAALLAASMLCGLTACTGSTGENGQTGGPNSGTTQENGTGGKQEGNSAVNPEEFTKLDYNTYYKFMLENADQENCIFSPESMNTAFDMYSYLLTEEDRKEIAEYYGNRPYLSYSSTNACKITNRLWINSNKEFHLPENTPLTSEYAYYIDMNDPKATEEKNRYVREQTNGFITSTSTEFTPDVVFDAMNILYFKDTWAGGDKVVVDWTTPFRNADGTQSSVLMMSETGDSYMMSDNAHAYCMNYEDGFRFLAILPDENVALEDVDVNAFVQGDVEIVDQECNFMMPEFESDSSYKLKLDDFGLPVHDLAKEVYDKPTEEPQITQVAKIRVDHEGTEAAAISEVLLTDCAVAISDPYYMTCDRPFIYVIQDTTNNDVAFIGVVRHVESSYDETLLDD